MQFLAIIFLIYLDWHHLDYKISLQYNFLMSTVDFFHLDN